MRFLLLVGLVSLFIAHAAEEAKPKLPLSISSRWIVDRQGNRVKLRCVNWAAHLYTMIPEGLHKHSIDWIATWIASQGFNCVRITYANEMALNPNTLVSASFCSAAASSGVPLRRMQMLFDQVVENNPFIKTATVLDVFAAVQVSLWTQNLMIIIDNHVSKAGDCCTLFDGNGWWADAPGYSPLNSRYFNNTEWLTGLSFMAQWSKSYPGIVGMSLRNELRTVKSQTGGSGKVWLERTTIAGNKVHAVNPDLLIIVGGIHFATDLRPADSRPGLSNFGMKRVWGVHIFKAFMPAHLPLNVLYDCNSIKVQYMKNFGFVLTKKRDTTGPLFVTEFGTDMIELYEDWIKGVQFPRVAALMHPYFMCAKRFLRWTDADWALQMLQGSYYARHGEADKMEPFGVFDRHWEDWQIPAFWGQHLAQIARMRRGPHNEEEDTYEEYQKEPFV